jgi:hypothetical protein
MDQAKERFMVGRPQVKEEHWVCTPPKNTVYWMRKQLQVLGWVRQEFDGLKMLLKSLQLLLK